MRRVLILGGTGWLGREIAQAALEDGAEVTCIARGRSGSVPDGARLLQSDRTAPGAYAEASGEWDDVVELAYDPVMVQTALDALTDRAVHWTLVSSVSVYRDHRTAGADESAELVEPTDPGNYAHAKVFAERATTDRVGSRALITRPGLIAGPGDPSDRFGYWVARFRQGGSVLAPRLDGKFVQVIDVQDLARWIVQAGRARTTGTIDAVGDSHTFDDFLTHVRTSTTFDGEVIQADDAWLLDQGVQYWAGPRSLPLWLPSEAAGMMQRSSARYLQHGGILRPLRTTIGSVRDDELFRGVGRERRSGLTRDEEAALLEAYQQR